MPEDKKEEKGFLFNVVSNIGEGHQIQAAFNLPVGAGKAEMDKIFDEYFASIKRQEARLRIPTIEMEVGRQNALVEGISLAVNRLKEAPALNGRRSTATEAQYQQTQTQLEADSAKLALLKKNLEATYKEAEVEVKESPCLIARANS